MMNNPCRVYTPDQELRVLSLYQPWASATPYGVKRIETRSWYASYRGWIAIHAGKQRLNGIGILTLSKARKIRPDLPERWFYDSLGRRQDAYPTGVIVALAWLCNCQIMTQWSAVVLLLRLLIKLHKRRDDSNLLPHWWLVLFTLSLTPHTIEIDAQSEIEKTMGDWRIGRFAWKFDSIQPLSQPIEMSGGQGLRWIKDEKIKAAIAADLAR